MDRETILRDVAEDSLLQEAGRRRFLYADVEELIEVGFLSHTVVVGDHAITFRSLLPSDLTTFQARTRGRKPDPLRWSLAASTWIIDGLEIPPSQGSQGSYHVYKDWYEELPIAWVEALAGIVMGLRNRISRAVRLAESFCYEPYSRGLWRMQGKPTSGLVNANIVRRLWVAHNLAEDASRAEDAQWQHTRAIVSSMSNKGGSQLGKVFQKEQDKEEARRRRVIEDAVNWVIQNEKEDQEPLTVMVNGQPVVVPKIHSAQTVEDLEEEMRRVFRGEKDYHDVLVDDYHKGIRQRVKQQQEARQKAVHEARQKAAEAEDQGIAPLVGYTKEQLQELNPGILDARTTSVSPENLDSSYMYDRYFQGDLKPGVLTPSLKVVDPEEHDPRIRREKVEGGPTLEEKIAQRKPKLGEPGASG